MTMTPERARELIGEDVLLTTINRDLLAGYLALAEENERLRAPPKITDAMVAAGLTFINSVEHDTTKADEDVMRALLTAALASTPGD